MRSTGALLPLCVNSLVLVSPSVRRGFRLFQYQSCFLRHHQNTFLRRQPQEISRYNPIIGVKVLTPHWELLEDLFRASSTSVTAQNEEFGDRRPRLIAEEITAVKKGKKALSNVLGYCCFMHANRSITDPHRGHVGKGNGEKANPSVPKKKQIIASDLSVHCTKTADILTNPSSTTQGGEANLRPKPSKKRLKSSRLKQLCAARC